MLRDRPLWSPLRVLSAVRWYFWWYVKCWEPGEWSPTLWNRLRYHARPNEQHEKGMY